MLGFKPDDKLEIFSTAYVDKATCRSVHVWPVPEDLENWYEIPFDPDFDYSGKRYESTSGEWLDVSEEQKRRVIAKRKEAYAKESDPLFMEFQFDKTPEAEKAWRDAVAAIKARYPFE